MPDGLKSRKNEKKGPIGRKNSRKIERKSKEKEVEKIDDARWVWYNIPKTIIIYNIVKE